MQDEVTLLVRADTVLEGFGADDAPLLHEDAAIAVAGGRVAMIGRFADLVARHPRAEVVGGAGQVAMPGLVNAHHHVGTTPVQLGAPDLPLELWFAARLGFRDLDMRLDTLFSAFEMLASGVTTVQHLHSRVPGGPQQVLDAARDVTAAYREVGMRASYSYALRDQNRLVYGDDAAFTASLPPELQPPMAAYFDRFTIPLAEQLSLMEDLLTLAERDPRIAIQLSPANLHWMSDDALLACAELSRRHRVPMHLHLLETPYQHEYAQRRTGGSAFAHLRRLGITGPHLTLGHGVWLSDADIDACAHDGTRICHNCSSNFRLKSGLAPVNRFLARGVPVALGIDEAGLNDDRDMLQEMRLVLRAHRTPGHDAPCPTPAQVLRMASQHGAGTTPFGSSVGRLSPGCHADIVLLDWRAVTWPWQDPEVPLVDVLVQRAKPASVKTVLVGGEVVLHEGRFTRIDRDAVLEEIAAFFARPLSAAEEARRAFGRAVFPHVRDFYRDWLSGGLPRLR